MFYLHFLVNFSLKGLWQIDALHALSPHGLDDPEEEGQREHRCVDDHVGNQQVNE